jgi:hypothetical protein
VGKGHGAVGLGDDSKRALEASGAPQDWVGVVDDELRSIPCRNSPCA